MRILVVEDDRPVANFLKSSLEAECFAVDVAEDGRQGSYMARIAEYDVMILDAVLPEKSGEEVCSELREKGKMLPILVLSAKCSVEDRIHFLNIGADDYLSKPFFFSEVLARVYALLRRPSVVCGEVLCSGNIALDIRQHRATCCGEPLCLTRKEIMLLEYFMRNEGRVVSRAMIMEHVWDIHLDPFSNTIESHIFSLRKKIAAFEKAKPIRTVSGRGYCWSLD